MNGTRWVDERLGVRLVTGPSSARRLDDLVGVALRRNPRRAHLLVSTVLGKHIPTDPREVYGAGRALGALVAAELGGADALVLGYAETATALGHAVADELDADYLHSTRRRVAGVDPVGGFEEEHSHATSHLLLPEDPALLTAPRPVVLVDDELSTGRTALNTIAALHALAARDRYVIATLVDLRGPADCARVQEVARGLGTRIDVVAAATGTVEFGDGFAEAAAALVDGWPQALRRDPTVRPDAVTASAEWPAGVREGGRHGFTAADRPAARAAAEAVADKIGSGLTGERVLVLGFEELMYAPLLIALALSRRGGPTVRFSSTTRSPVLAVDEPGYPIRTALAFSSHDDPCDGPSERYAYNVAPGADGTPFSDVVLVVDDAGDTAALHAADGLVAALGAVCGQVHLVTLPCHGRSPARHPEPLRGPGFGSYRADEVGWLLTDLSHIELEAPTEEREEAIQSGGAHYAESLPVEYQPSEEYRRLFDEALAESARRLAHAVGVVTELVLAERGPSVVLASLARAGTPVGILMRRWAAYAHGLDVPHYAVSIVRGRGIDGAALRYLAGHHRSADVCFVDGWTGKGAIARELAAAVDGANAELRTAFNADLAVLADTGSCVSTFGTRADFLIPSACLNSTVSGLVSRTVLNPVVLAPGQYHGAKFYRSLASADVSVAFLDAVAARFADVADDVAAAWPVLQRAERRPTWAGWAEVERISAEFGIGDVNLVKPGVGETTRVLLRRVPWKVLVRPDAAAELAHVRLLAEQRGVEVVDVPGLAYSCVGLIHPRYTRGATGADGAAVHPS